MKNQKYFLIVFVLLSGCISVTAQECNCLENYQSLSQMIRVNYPGFQDKTAATKKQRFTEFSDSLYREVQQQKDTYQCYLSLKALISYFKDPHLTININNSNATKEQLRTVFSTLPADLITTRKTTLSQKKSIAIEGLWEIKGQGNYYRMRISKNAEGNFTGVLVNADSVFWFPGQVKMIVKEEKGEFYKVTYLVRDHTPVELMVNVDEDGLLNCGTYGIWQRVGNDALTAKVDLLVRSKNRPGLTMLNGSTAYLRIPSFDPSVKDTLASILESNSKLMQSKNLVIDLRDNTGGSILGSNLLLKYIYDGPISIDGSSFLASAQNISDFETNFKRPELAPYYTDSLRATVERLKKQPDSLVSFSEKGLITLDSVYPAPQNVYIIINKASASASEYFVLQAKQSKKVKIIGQNTKGAIDYLNVGFPRMLPCQLFYLLTPLTRSNRPNNRTLDNTGIAPDILLPNDEDALLFIKTKLIKE
jgi:hypothetical protein